MTPQTSNINIGSNTLVTGITLFNAGAQQGAIVARVVDTAPSSLGGFSR